MPIVMKLTLCFCILVTIMEQWNYKQAFAKELEVTEEWQVVKEGDTLPAGAHIRIDMTTGEKWVKMADSSDGDQDGGNLPRRDLDINADSNVCKSEKEVTPAQSNSLVSSMTKEEQELRLLEEQTKPDSKFDFYAMYQALSKLTPDVLGDIELPSLEDKDFEKRMIQIWDIRQAELKELERLIELADVPKILKHYIATIRRYYRQQYKHCADTKAQEYEYGSSEKLLLDVKLDDIEDIFDRNTNLHMTNLNTPLIETDEKYEPPETVTIDDISYILKEVEFLLSDIDMARDFHTLGGWPVLASLLNPPLWLLCEVPDNIEQRHKLQIMAAWSVGNAVKNHAEFVSWATESIPQNVANLLVTLNDHDPILAHGTNNTSVMSLLLQVLKDPLSSNNSIVIQKSIYALASLLRGNRQAQTFFLQLQGPLVLGDLLEAAVNGEFSHKLAFKVLSLAHDILMELAYDKVEESSLEYQQHQHLIAAFTSSAWCDSAWHLLTVQVTNIDDNNQHEVERVLKTIQPMVAHCGKENHDWIRHRQEVERLRDKWYMSARMDPDWRDELVQLANDFLELMDKIGY